MENEKNNIIYFKYELKKVSDILCCNENPLLKHLFNALKFCEVSGNLDCQSKVTCIWIFFDAKFSHNELVNHCYIIVILQKKIGFTVVFLAVIYQYLSIYWQNLLQEQEARTEFLRVKSRKRIEDAGNSSNQVDSGKSEERSQESAVSTFGAGALSEDIYSGKHINFFKETDGVNSL